MSVQGDQEFSTEVQASVAQCFATIVDFEAYPEWSSPIESAVVLERYPNRLARLVEFHLDMKLRTVRYVLEYKYEKPHRLTWHATEGDVESVSGSYVFEKLGAGHTGVTCRQGVSLGFWVPGFVRATLERQALRQSVLEFKAEVERRAAAGPDAKAGKR